jgi:hypothetical protein
MAGTAYRTLTLSTTGTNTTVKVDYKASFNTLERFLAEHGLVFRERIQVLGVDSAGKTVLHTFPQENIPVAAGVGTLIVPRTRSLTASRSSLQEDVDSADEIQCRIDIDLVGFAASAVGHLTPQETLLG